MPWRLWSRITSRRIEDSHRTQLADLRLGNLTLGILKNRESSAWRPLEPHRNRQLAPSLGLPCSTAVACQPSQRISETKGWSAAKRRPRYKQTEEETVVRRILPTMEGLVRRAVEPWARELLTVSPVLTVEGARQTGKSTLAQMLTDGTQAKIVSLDEPDVLMFAREDSWIRLPTRPW
jgi:AAA family ATPase